MRRNRQIRRDIMDEMQKVDNHVENVKNAAGGSQDADAIDYEALYHEASKSITDLTAERDSLLTENKDLRAKAEAAISDGAKARELNYTLARQLDLGTKNDKQPEEYLAAMFLGQKED